MQVNQMENSTEFKMTRGDSESITVVCEQIPFTEGDKITFTMRKFENAKEKELEKVVTEFDEGKAIIEFRPEDTENLTFRKYFYDIEMRRADGMVKTILKGHFEIEWEATY